MALFVNILIGIAIFCSVAQAIYVNGSIVAPCDSPLYCYGELLRQVQLAGTFADSKTFVDMPGKRSLDQILAAFDKLDKPLANNEALHNFLADNFAKAGSELVPVPRQNLTTNPTFLDRVHDTVIHQFAEKVIDIWPDLTRSYVGTGQCEACPTSYIPINRPFVIAGGRFREPYYWDSFWIIEGLLRTGGSFVDISRYQIENLLDLVDRFGFVPNGARVYFLNRSQPPLLAQMVRVYIEYTGDVSILDRALPLLIREHQFWMTNRTVDVCIQNQTHQLNRYSVANNQPRPESYVEDYVTVNNQSYYSASGSVYPQTAALDDAEQDALYADLAAGAESGWDYSSRWMARPDDAQHDSYFPLRSIQTQSIVPVDLNSILYGTEVAIASFFRLVGNESAANDWDAAAVRRCDAMYAVLWNETMFSYYDFNLTAHAQEVYTVADSDWSSLSRRDRPQESPSSPPLAVLSPADQERALLAAAQSTAPPSQQAFVHLAQYFPFWTGAAPAHLKNSPLAVRTVFEPVADRLDVVAGGIAATNLHTNQQWDEPNVWPPLMHVLMDGLLATPPTFGRSDPDWIWVQDLALRLAQRYLDSTFCTWRATGGSLAGDLSSTNGRNGSGVMFEKYADYASNVAGSGGEYDVVEGFGWTNGVLLWVVDVFADRLRRPDCARQANPAMLRARSAVEIPPADAEWVEHFR